MLIREPVRLCHQCPIRQQESSVEAIVPVAMQRHLSARELQVAVLVVVGRTNEQIARELLVGTSTIKKHITRILAKSGSRSRTEFTSKWWAGGPLRGHARPPSVAPVDQ
ncbi:response regulator transcription factor [Plantactinospora sp. GCM10030261]|uniref:response regulator transcription factor n=1 Tax=Plantactinospora sp. GCM10030261 TaxID=3273420 RepID=UPI00362243C7